MTKKNYLAFMFILVAVLATGLALAQQYSGGSHSIVGSQGTLVINSGFVNNFNIHTFQVYSFLLKPRNETGWQQVPLIESTEHPEMKFIVMTANTADFTLRDFKVYKRGSELVLKMAQKKYKKTPYDEHAWIEVRCYELRKLRDEGRWVFQFVASQNMGTNLAVEQALNDDSVLPTNMK